MPSDLKMENVAVSGFDHSKPNENVRDIIVRLADCGAGKLNSPLVLVNTSDLFHS